MPQWEQFQRIQPAGEVKRFGEGLIKLGEDSGLWSLDVFGKQLLDSLSHVDIIKLRKTLSEFPSLIQQIRSFDDRERG